MEKHKEYRVLIGLREVAGYCTRLKMGFEQIGVTAHFLDLGGNYLNYNAGKNPAWINFFGTVSGKLGARFSGSYFLRALWLLVFQNFLSIPALIISIFRYDVFIFCSNSTFFYFLELPLLKLLGKKVIYVFLGSDSRPIYLNGYLMDNPTHIGLNAFICRMQKFTVKIIERMADYCINHPPQAYFHERKFISSLCVGLPVNLNIDGSDQPKRSAGAPVRILHAPSKTGPKGSALFKIMIERLKAKGYNIDYVEVSGVPNAEVLRLINSCDFILDEMYSDTPMAVFASEAAAAGKPAVVGSYYCDKMQKDFPAEYIPPNAFVHPDDVEKAIEKLITDEQYRVTLGLRAKQFVTERWKASKVAMNFLRIFKNDIPAEWYYAPAALTYLHGCGLPEDKARKNIWNFIEKKGIGSLCISDKQSLENEMRKFASAN